ncbi:MAG: HIT family hydrolase [Planctomycetes bacterium SM23_32]|nr:MAG: HIT family hydrolase [Planctomycetes bacterium SM23_32]
MKQLWAPWRMEYIGRPDREGACFLCEAAAAPDDRRRLVLWRGTTSFCLMNCWPYNNGHLMVAPLAHKGDLGDLSEEELLEQMRLVRRCCRGLTALMSPAGFNIGLNLGKAAGAGVPGHMHWHVVPRWEADTNFMPVVADTKVIPQSLDELWQQLRDVDAG